MEVVEAVRAGLRYRGRVQGVGFRWRTRALAEGRAITGLVQNDPDGTVWLEAQGTPIEVDAFLAAIAEHMAANIEAMERTDLPVVAGESGFQIAG